MDLTERHARYHAIRKRYYPNSIVAIFDLLNREFKETQCCPFCEKESHSIYKDLNIPLYCDCKKYRSLCSDVAFFKDPFHAVPQM